MQYLVLEQEHLLDGPPAAAICHDRSSSPANNPSDFPVRGRLYTSETGKLENGCESAWRFPGEMCVNVMAGRAEANMFSAARFQFTSTDGVQIACARWDSQGPLRGVIQIAHGMGEHIGRYAGVIEVLVSDGFTVYGNDHRGHGRTTPSAAHLGDFGDGGFDLLVEDVVHLSRIAKKENPNIPFILLGHSMGSFASQQYVLDHSREIDGLILSGSGALDGLARSANSVAPGTNILNARFEPARTPVDWLSRDSAVVDAFLSDPLCFAQLQPASFASFLAAGSRLSDPQSLRKIRADLPVYLFSGSDDPVGPTTGRSPSFD